MRITAVHPVAISVPFREPVAWRYGEMAGFSSVVVRVSTDEGVEGIGEVPGVPSVALALAALDFFTPLIVGEDPLRVSAVMVRAASAGSDHFPYVANVALGGLEMALWDICGKLLGCPVHQFFGGPTTRRIPFYWHVLGRGGEVPGTGELGHAVAHARAGLEQGFKSFYLKGGELVDDLALLESVRDALGPDVALRIDPNEGWPVMETLAQAERLRALDLDFLEQPFDRHDHRAARELRERTGIRVGANQSAWLLRDVAAVIEERAADVVVTGVHQAGGLSAFSSAETLCRLARVPIVRHSLCELGIGTAAALSVLATWPAQELAHQTHLTLFEHDIVGHGFTFREGRLDIPEGPGLGVTIDEDALGRDAERYAEMGEYTSYMPR